MHPPSRRVDAKSRTTNICFLGEVNVGCSSTFLWNNQYAVYFCFRNRRSDTLVMFTPAGPKLFHVRQQSFQGHCRWFSHISPLLRCLALSNPDPLSRWRL